jgi:hypothetical protein
MKNLVLCDHLTAATLEALITNCSHSICSVVYGSGNADLAGIGVGRLIARRLGLQLIDRR